MSGLIVDEWLEPHGGAEQVVDAMCQAFPTADLLVLWNDNLAAHPEAMETWLARTPLRNHKALAMPWMPLIWRHVHPYKTHKRHDWLLVSSYAFAHQVRPGGMDRDIPKYVYAHTPARYIWAPELDGRGNSLWTRSACKLFFKPLDRMRAKEPCKIAANSKFVRDRIRNTWERDADVIYPPVNVKRIQSVLDWRTQLDSSELRLIESLPKGFILGASRFVPYKRLDWVIRAGVRLNVPVVIAGSGPEEDRLRRIASNHGSAVTFVIKPSNPLLYALYQAASAYVFPAIEDFGIMPIEAQAAGTPVVTTSFGGATESHLNGVTGVTADSDDPDSFGRAVATAMDLRRDANFSCIANRFTEDRFRRAIQAWMLETK